MAISDELEKLQKLRESGALTDEEFQAAKRTALGGSPPPPPPGATPVTTAPMTEAVSSPTREPTTSPPDEPQPPRPGSNPLEVGIVSAVITLIGIAAFPIIAVPAAIVTVYSFTRNRRFQTRCDA